MRILIVTPYLKYPGGVEKMNEYLKDILLELGHKVDFLTTQEEDAKMTPKWRIRLFGKPAMTARAFERRKKDFDLVICNGEFGWGINWKNVITVFHGSFKGVRDGLKGEIPFRSYLSLSWQSLLQRISSKNKYVITVSKYCKQVLNEQGVKVNLIIPNFVSFDDFFPTTKLENRSGYLFVGKYNYKGKGIDILEKLSDEIETSITCVTDKKTNDKLLWMESTSTTNLREVYNKHRILIFPSRFESSGLVALEAMACGLPVIMNRVGCALELENEIPEFVCTTNEVAKYKEKISIIEADYENFSKKALDFVRRNYSKEQFRDNWAKVLENKC